MIQKCCDVTDSDRDTIYQIRKSNYNTTCNKLIVYNNNVKIKEFDRKELFYVIVGSKRKFGYYNVYVTDFNKSVKICKMVSIQDTITFIKSFEAILRKAEINNYTVNAVDLFYFKYLAHQHDNLELPEVVYTNYNEDDINSA